MSDRNESWLFEISSKRKWIDLNFKEIWRYRDLLVLFVKRDIVTVYKQTVLGPLWFFIQPLFTSVIFTLIFNKVASIETGIIPAFLFNLSGITAWNYFKVCLNGTAATFKANKGIFGKVYFPRFIVPLSKVISNLVKFGIQMLILAGFYLYYFYTLDEMATPDWNLLLVPAYVIIMAIYGLGLGMIVSTMTTKYRDVSILLGFAMQLLMYLSAVPYPIKALKEKVPEFAWVVDYNPLAHIVEGFRYALFSTDNLQFNWTIFGGIVALGIVLFLLGLVLFNRTEKTFIDTV
ncbi:ABC transporter permease [Aureisphaera galaxeae]|uniref:ABC transporter permease n=1 Tax=Aureisphaera galaxeae TaxID=1538023 RepID=UPI00235053DD|nr:ABC transporter permease [Aureisphaera galaxeae]MDC8006278.1 ABC transporter permease [Aureisphaera galaxeae]